MEQLLHYVWRHKIFPLTALQTTSGQPVEVIDTGLPNMNAGPDFFNAKLKIDGTIWVGNVEIHTRSSDWYRHGHQLDNAYNSIILHVVGEADCEVTVLTERLFPNCYFNVPKASAVDTENCVRQRFIHLVTPFSVHFLNLPFILGCQFYR